MNKKDIINEYLDYLQELEPLSTATAVASALQLVWGAVNFYKNNMTNAAKKCSSLDGDSKKLCMIKIKITELSKLISKIKSSMSICSKEKDAEKRNKCVDKIKEKVISKQEELKKLKYQMSSLIQLYNDKKRNMK